MCSKDLYVVPWIILSGAMIVCNKFIFSMNFHFPITLGCMHMLSCFFTCLLLKYSKIVTVRDLVCYRTFRAKIFPLSVLTTISLLCSNAAYIYLSISYMQMLKTFMPVLTWLLTFICDGNKTCDDNFYGIAIITFGVFVASYSTENLNATGIILQSIALLSESAKLVFIQFFFQGNELKSTPANKYVELVNTAENSTKDDNICLENDEKTTDGSLLAYLERPTAIELMYYLSPLVCLQLFVAFLCIELPYISATRVPTILPLNLALAVVLNLAAFRLIKKINALTLNVAGVLKDILLIWISHLIFDDYVTIQKIIGYSLAFLGVLKFKRIVFVKPRNIFFFSALAALLGILALLYFCFTFYFPLHKDLCTLGGGHSKMECMPMFYSLTKKRYYNINNSYTLSDIKVYKNYMWDENLLYLEANACIKLMPSFSPFISKVNIDRAIKITVHWSFNFAHMMLEELPRLHTVSEKTLTNATVLVNSDTAKNIIFLLYPSINVSIINVRETVVHTKVLEVPPAANCVTVDCKGAVWMYERLRGNVSEDLIVYVSRTKKSTTTGRLVNNEEAALAIIREVAGEKWKVMKVIPTGTSINTFKRAKIIIGMHGAALTNSVFMPSGAIIIEFRETIHIKLFMEWAKCVNAQHFSIPILRDDTNEWNSNADVDIKALNATLRSLLV